MTVYLTICKEPAQYDSRVMESAWMAHILPEPSFQRGVVQKYSKEAKERSSMDFDSALNMLQIALSYFSMSY